MGKPAARQGDMTVHGGAIVVGCPTVLIGGMPAARMGDMHTCPMQTPGTPPIPHVGGPIAISSAPTVLIGGMPAACVGDMAICVGPPDSIAPPGCPTVMIGPGGGGGGGGAGAGSGGGSGQAQAETGTSGQGEGEEGEEEEGHYLDVRFTDQGGFPLTGQGYTHTNPDGNVATGVLAGRLRNTGLSSTGSHEIALHSIVSAKWSASSAQDGETVKMKVETAGFDDGTTVEIEIKQRDFNRADRTIETRRNLTISGNKVEEEWVYEYPERDREATQTQRRTRYSSPVYYFVAKIEGYSARSDILNYKDWIEIELLDSEGNPVANADYEIHFSNGEIRRGQLDSNGRAREERVPTATHEIRFPNNPESTDSSSSTPSE